MASPTSQQALSRKLIYTALILVLFTGAWAWRHYAVDKQAVDLGIREQSRGEVELSGALLRLILTGSRGYATAALWLDAQEKQKRNEWNLLELRVRQVAKLQPHFITPWLFQSWNLSYNVSVEADRVSDKYFYISRGISLLAQGEKQNRNDPDMRWYIGFYTQHKIGQSDETNTLRSLFQLSCLPPNERDPARFWELVGGRRQFNMVQFEEFCKKHPQLVRRLKEGMRREMRIDQERQFYCQSPEAVVKFLGDNAHVPSLYQDVEAAAVGTWQDKQDRKKPEDERFPVLPPATRDAKKDPRTSPLDANALTAATDPLRDGDDAHQVARAWFSYALEPIPDPDELPGSTKNVEDRAKWRRNRYMTTVIFRSYPGQGQRMSCERLQEEGWYDDTGWEIPDWFVNQGTLTVGQGRPWSLEAWKEAYRIWDKHGQDSHLKLSAADEDNYLREAEKFSRRFGVSVGTGPPPGMRIDTLDAEGQNGYFASRFLFEYNYARNVSNFAHFLTRTRVEATEPAVKARKLFFDAETLRLAGSPPTPVLAKYEHPDALKGWRDMVLLGAGNKDFRRDSFIQEQTFEIQHRYLKLLGSVNAVPLSRQVAQLALLPVGTPPTCGAVPVGLYTWLAWPNLHNKPWESPLFAGPFDGSDPEGVPLIAPHVRKLMMDRLYPGLVKKNAPPDPGSTASPPPTRPPQKPVSPSGGKVGPGK